MPGNGSDDPQTEDFHELRKLILGPEEGTVERVEQVEQRLDDPRLRTEDISHVLPQAILLRAKHDDALERALEQPVAKSIETSVRKDPQPIVDAIFPVIGPAIRKAIAHALRGMVQQFNKALEHSLSPKSLLWRLEARRTGRTFAEVVMLKSLVYRVEQVFLIHRETGLLLRHLEAEEVIVKDVDMVSAMLTAIQDFIQDSFSAREGEGVETLQVGEFSVWVEQGPHAVLAAVIRGTAPEELRSTLKTALEGIEADMGRDLESFEGDATPFEVCDPALETCLRKAVTKKKKSTLIPVLTFFLALFGILYVGYLIVEAQVTSRRWEAYVARLAEEPGIVVTSHERQGDRLHVVGLRDPLARDPLDLLEHFKPSQVVGRWQLYHALEPRFVLGRARRRLAPPEGVELALEGDRLVLSGDAPHAWVRRARTLGAHLADVAGIDDSGLVDTDARHFDELRRTVESEPVTPITATGLASRLKEMERLGTLLERPFRVAVAGPEAAEVVRRLAAREVASKAESSSSGSTRVRIVVAE